jgi:hypothetical protein
MLPEVPGYESDPQTLRLNQKRAVGGPFVSLFGQQRVVPEPGFKSGDFGVSHLAI